MLFHSLPPPSPHYPACQWCGALIGGPGLSRHGNCTKANKGVEQSRGNTVTQRGYLAQWKISGEAPHKSQAAAKHQSTWRFVLPFTKDGTSQHSNIEICSLLACTTTSHMNSLSLFSQLWNTLTYANDSTGDVIKLHSFSAIFHP